MFIKTTSVGIDPGKNGAIASIGRFGSVKTFRIPLIKGKGRSEYNLPEIVSIIQSFNYASTVFFVEKSQPMPPKMGGGIANFHRGVARGWEWLLAGSKFSYYLVAAKTWQKEMLRDVEGKDTKQRSLIQAGRLFPMLEIGKHHGLSDALLIAEYGRRQLKI